MSSAALRILDANFNRAREGLRVWEDYARFGLNDDALCVELKQLRHNLTAAVKHFVPDAIHHRDTPGDVGTDNKTGAEMQRPGLADVVTAAGKRLQEALRTIEEYLKIVDPSAVGAVEGMRYQSYELELRLARTLRPGRFDDVRLYVLITESLCHRPWLETAEMAIAGGADCLQLREKDLEGAELLSRCRSLADLCRRHGVLCIMNDRPDIALLAGADGVHVGQGDLPCREVRKIVGNDMLIGVSTHNLDQARAAELDGADYIGVGPVFPSKTKPRSILPGLDYARAAAKAVHIPCVAIAGITHENAAEVLQSGVRSLAVSSAIISREDPKSAASELTAIVNHNSDVVAQTFLSVSPIPPPTTKPAPLRERRRNLPHWTLEGATYFLTFRVKDGSLSKDERQIVLQHLRSNHGLYYDLFAAVVMPDHAHLILRPMGKIALDRILKGTKGVTARLINEHRKRRGSVWMDESFDRIIRSQAEFDEKVEYIYDNPVRAGLVAEGMQYDAIFMNNPRL